MSSKVNHTITSLN